MDPTLYGGAADVATVTVRSLSKRYPSRDPSHAALDEVSFDVHAGEVLGVLGPNGAGKSTLLETIEGLRAPSAGQVRVLGLDPTRRRRAVHAVVGVQLQGTHHFERLRAQEAVELFAAMYDVPVDGGVLAAVGLGDRAATLVGQLSGGQRRRLDLAVALVNDPRILILDEPTAGLDAHARRRFWRWLSAIVEERRVTVLLATHLLVEAETFCDRVVVLDRGRIVAQGRPDEIVARHGDPGASLEDVFVALTDDLVDGPAR